MFQLLDKLKNSASHTILFLESKIQGIGSYGDDITDLAFYFKSPMMFLAANKPQAAEAILNYIQLKYMCDNGDFKTKPTIKSSNTSYIEFWTYMNGWIIRAAHHLNITSISKPGYEYINQYYLRKKGFLTNYIENKPQVTDILTVAHHGLINLEMNKMDIAISAGYFLYEALKKQINLQEGFYLRFDIEGNIITKFSKNQSAIYLVSATQSNQLHFMIGYPAAYLTLLYQKTNNLEFFTAAKAYLDFSISCDKSVYNCNFSHKIAWAASLIYQCTGEEQYLTIIEKISDYFITKQKNGMWYTDNIIDSYDQSAEIACWFLNIVKNISDRKYMNLT